MPHIRQLRADKGSLCNWTKGPNNAEHRNYLDSKIHQQENRANARKHDSARNLLAIIATPKGRKVVVCPATHRDDVSCKTCGLCAVRDRKVIVGFPAHGVHKSRASAIATA